MKDAEYWKHVHIATEKQGQYDYWKKIWEEKGQKDTTDLRWLDGFEKSLLKPEEIAKWIMKSLNIMPSDKVLEVGCGAGMLAQHIAPCCLYTGIDYSKSLIQKQLRILGTSALVAEADDLPFKDKYFDVSFAYSVFHYFPGKKYVKDVVNEMTRTTKRTIFIGDLPLKSNRDEHLIFKTSDFDFDAIFEMKMCNPNRFNMKILLC
jgi:SAM-dependent methyltransferase